MKKREREAGFLKLYHQANVTGLAAGRESVPTPMVVVGGVPGGAQQRWVVDEGPCGFAWVVVRPGNSSFARWLVKEDLASKHYYGGVSIWTKEFGQSMTRKDAYARAFAEVLQGAGIDAHADSRMD